MLHMGTLAALLDLFLARPVALLQGRPGRAPRPPHRRRPGPQAGRAAGGERHPGGAHRRPARGLHRHASSAPIPAVRVRPARRRRHHPVRRRPLARAHVARWRTCASATRWASASRRRSPSSRASAAPASPSAAGLFLGLKRDAAARFAFLMGTPIIAGAGLWKMRELLDGGAGAFDPLVLAAGMIAAAISRPAGDLVPARATCAATTPTSSSSIDSSPRSSLRRSAAADAQR